jgi:hypothetical protein
MLCIGVVGNGHIQFRIECIIVLGVFSRYCVEQTLHIFCIILNLLLENVDARSDFGPLVPCFLA